MDFAQIWYAGSLLVPKGPAIVEIHLPWNLRWRTAPNFQSLNGYNSGVHWSISLKFSTEFQHVTANTHTLLQGQGWKVKVTAYVTGNTDSLRNLWDYLTYLTWAVGVATSTWVATRKYTRRPKTQYFQSKRTRKTLNVWRDVVRPWRCNAFAIARFLVSNISNWWQRACVVVLWRVLMCAVAVQTNSVHRRCRTHRLTHSTTNSSCH